MGKIKYLNEVKTFILKGKAFNVKDIKRFLISKHANPDYAYSIIHNMMKKGHIHRITKGYYSRFDDPMIITYCIKPSYIGLENALSIHGLWEQESNVVLITPRRIRFGIRKIFNTNVIIHHINKKYFFGYDYIDYYDLKIPVSDTEKTFIDWIYYHNKMNIKLLNDFIDKIDRKKLNKYLKNYDKKFAEKVQSVLKHKNNR